MSTQASDLLPCDVTKALCAHVCPPVFVLGRGRGGGGGAEADAGFL